MTASKTKTYQVAIIGGGAAGLMAAYHSKLNHPEYGVILIDKNKYLGAKVIISGGGRCNVTTGIEEPAEVLKNYPRGSEFLKTAMYNFPPLAVRSWFESQGVPLKCEADLRVFPVSNNGKDIVGALENALKDLEVEILLNSAAENLTYQQDQKLFQITFKNGQTIQSEKVIITTGGSAYRHTGSTGDGYAFAQALRHTITPLAPSLSSFYLKEKWFTELSGISFKKIKIDFPINDQTPNPQPTGSNSQTSLTRTGPALITHQGISGPAVFALSGLAAYQKFSPEKPQTIYLNFFPDLNRTQLEALLLQDFQKNPAKKLNTVLGFLIPSRLADQICNYTLEKQTTKSANQAYIPNCSEVSKTLRQALLANLQKLPMTLIGRGAGDEFVTAGGIPLDEINPKTMESLKQPGLFFAGEIMDVDGFTGGFNLQASWATGTLAGENV